MPTRPWVAIAFVFFAGLLSACRGQGSSFLSTGPSLQRTYLVKASSTASPSPIPFRYQTVDDPNSNTNAVTGINQLGKVSGVYGAGSASNIPVGFSSRPPYSVFTRIFYPSAQGTAATSLSSNKIVAGYVIHPKHLGGIWAFVRINGLFTLIRDKHEGSGRNAVTEIHGIDDSELATGYYLNSSGSKVPFELNISTEAFTKLKPPGARDAEATGINGRGNVSGWERGPNGRTTAFYMQAGTYYPISRAGAKATFALGLNWQDQVVGDYVERNGATHGFVLTDPTKGGKQQIWQRIDEPKAVFGTWVTGINNHDDICGYYVDAKGVQHGFVAVPK